MTRLFRRVLDARRRAESRRSDDTRIDPRRRRARLRAHARVRRGVRQSRPDRGRGGRRRRGGDRAARRFLEGHPVRQRRARRGRCCPSFTSTATRSPASTVLARQPDESIRKLFEGHGYEVHFVEGADPLPIHRAFAGVLDTCVERIRTIQSDARTRGIRGTPRWPLIRPAHAQRLDGPEARRRLAVRGHVSRAPGPAPRRAHRSGPARAARGVAAQLHRPEQLFDPGGRLLAPLRASRSPRPAAAAWAPNPLRQRARRARAAPRALDR